MAAKARAVARKPKRPLRFIVGSSPYGSSLCIVGAPSPRRRVRSAPASSDDPRRVLAAPEEEAEDEVEADDGDDRHPDRPARRLAHAGRTAGGVVAVVAVDQGDDHGEEERL